MVKCLLMAATFVGALASPLFAQDTVHTGRLQPDTAAEGPTDPQGVRESPAPIKVATVEFVSDAPLPAKAEERLRRYMTRRVIYDTPDWLEELEGRTKDAWQEYGYFFPEIQTSVRKLGQYPFEHNFALTFHVDAGGQYRLGDIRITGAKLFSEEILRSCFDVHEGDIFDTHTVRAGIDSLRSGYDHQGYINIVVVPSTQIDETRKRISVLLHVEEGQQFRIGQVIVLGLSEDAADKLTQASGLKRGAVFSSKLIEAFFRKNRSVLPIGVDEEADVERRINDATATVDLTLHLGRDQD
jgi:outer membrane protein assembly factor BamA